MLQQLSNRRPLRMGRSLLHVHSAGWTSDGCLLFPISRESSRFHSREFGNEKVRESRAPGKREPGNEFPSQECSYLELNKRYSDCIGRLYLSANWLLGTELSLDVAMSWRHQHHQRPADDASAAASSRTSLEAATEAAQRINAVLIAKGMLKPSQVSSVPHKVKQQVLRPLSALYYIDTLTL